MKKKRYMNLSVRTHKLDGEEKCNVNITTDDVEVTEVERKGKGRNREFKVRNKEQVNYKKK